MESTAGRSAFTDAAAAMAGFLAAGGWLVAVPLRDFSVPYLALAAGIAVVGSADASILRRKPRFTTPADRVTLLRAVLVACCATMAVPVLLGSPPGPSFVVLGGLAFLLDAVDGAVARRTGSSSQAGARLDVQTDAALVLVLSCAAVRSLGPWVLAVGLMWYAFVAAGRIRPALRGVLRPNRLRKVIGAYQAFALLLALTPGVPEGLGTGAVALALLTLAASFGRDVLELERTHRRPAGHGSGAELVN